MDIGVLARCLDSCSHAVSAGHPGSPVAGSSLAVDRTAVVDDRVGNHLVLVGRRNPAGHSRHTVVVGRIVVAGCIAEVDRTAMAASSLAGRTVVEVVASRSHRTAEGQVSRTVVAAHRGLGCIDCSPTLL